MALLKALYTILLLPSLSAGLVTKTDNESAAPVVTIKNGTYEGRYEPAYGTDYFLGIPYAQPPVGNLRFRTPQSLNTSWSGSRNATEYGYECIGYGRDTWSQGNYVSEDCLTLNVVRPKDAGEGLPVLVWIHGGGLVMGGSADRRYNQSFIVQESVKAGTPVIAVSINYRLSSWGFLYGKEIQESGNTMLGFRDQRLALHWVRENIAAFGGDPSRVTIQGESSGGTSVAAQLLAYNGRDDKLFAGAIAQSGNIAGLGAYPTVEDWEPVIANISRGVGCNNTTRSVLDCLRTIPTDKLNSVLNSTLTSGASFGFVVDNDLIVAPASSQLEKGAFVKVPYIVGVNSDEGTGFSRPVNTTAQLLQGLTAQGYDNATAQDLSILYPDIPDIGIPATLPGRPNATIGSQFKRTSAMYGDMSMTAPRRLSAQMWTKHGVPAYSYRFNVLVNGISYIFGAVHFQEVAFVFHNTEGYGYPQNGNPSPLGGPERAKYLRVAKLMTRMWISFVNFGDPNRGVGDLEATHWPVYTLENPRQFVFEQNVTSHAESDWYRAEGIQYISDLILSRRGTECSGIEACRNNAWQ
ncbi:hypothetical protein M409DRAFT_64945 [Zasmidium cellare ATCC 36951]|uniref:Carboxylic ester hydrolase n=1 Tax=Zasmidium cellare ATCC 36951 TaxID=1080233 RepID=A0A6A6CTU3_ZASCE|nr:uncharacterized protein M409DRAFT_64945 [Zasmidium cellare ATCC 36951]KAF2169199.1 hypothetical protein M409DRAFT_64945 [Zasmidium cellare ATCC 36951]